MLLLSKKVGPNSDAKLAAMADKALERESAATKMIRDGGVVKDATPSWVNKAKSSRGNKKTPQRAITEENVRARCVIPPICIGLV